MYIILELVNIKVHVNMYVCICEERGLTLVSGGSSRSSSSNHSTRRHKF